MYSDEGDPRPKNFVMNRQAFNRRMERQSSTVGKPDEAEIDYEFWGKRFGKETALEWSK